MNRSRWIVVQNETICRQAAILGRLAIVVVSILLGTLAGSVNAAASTAAWVRPADWQTLPEVRPGEQKMFGLFGVFPVDDNFVALVAEGDYVVDWGDGSPPEKCAAGTKATHTFDYATCGGPQCYRGYKTVVVTVTPQAGQALTRLDLNHQRTIDGRSNWLDLTISSKELKTLVIGWRNPCVSHRLLEQVTIKEQQLTDVSYLFNICSNLQSVPLFDTSRVTTMAAMFWGAMRFSNVPHFDTRNVTSMGDMFRECYSVEQVPAFDTSKVTTMACMFRYAVSLREPPLFDTSNVENMTMMFQYCWNLRRVPRYNTAKVTNMRWMFQNCFVLQNVPAFDTSNLVDMRSMFSGAQALLAVPALNVARVDDFSGTFNGCGRLSQNLLQGATRDLDVSNQSLSSAELNRIYSNLGTVSGKTINVSGNYGVQGQDPSLATNKGWLVKNESPVNARPTASTTTASLPSLSDSTVGDTSTRWTRATDWPVLPTVGDEDQKFVGLHAVFPFADNFCALSAAGDYSVDWGDGSPTERFSAGKTAEHNFRFDVCPGSGSSRGYKTVIVTVTPENGQPLTRLDLHRRHSAVPAYSTPPRTNWLDVTVSSKQLESLTIGSLNPQVFHMLLEQVTIRQHRLTHADRLFYHCTALQSVPLFDTSSITSMAGMFMGARSISELPLFDTRNVTNMQDMFRDCGALSTIPRFDTHNVTNMSGMFQSAFLLSTVPLLDTANVTNMNSMFQACWRLLSIPHFNTAKVVTMRQMCQQCGLLLTIPAFDTRNVEDMHRMFQGSWSMAVIPDLDVSKVKDFSFVFGEADGPCRQIAQIGMRGISHDINLSHKTLSGPELNRIFANLARVEGRVLSVAGNYGLADADLTVATSKGWRINAAPQLDAGPDQTIKLSQKSTVVTATVRDDGLPNPSEACTYVWFQAAWAPSIVTYGTQRGQSTTMTFAAPGRYRMRCTVSDGHLTTDDDVVITVEP